MLKRFSGAVIGLLLVPGLVGIAETATAPTAAAATEAGVPIPAVRTAVVRAATVKTTAVKTAAVRTAAAKTAAAKTAHRSTVKLPARCKIKAHVLCADKTTHKLYYVNHGTIERTLSAAFGRRYYRTREGTFRIQRKAKNWVSTIYHSPMPYAMFFSGGQAVHYSHAFFKDRHHQSHGCINIRDKKTLAYVFSKMHVGDRVVVYRS